MSQHIRLTFRETELDKYNQDSEAQNYYESIKKNLDSLEGTATCSKTFGFPNRETYVDLFLPDGVDATTLTGDRPFVHVEDVPPPEITLSSPVPQVDEKGVPEA